MFFPSVIETTGRSSKAFDLPTKLLQDRIIYLGSDINPAVANLIIMQLLWLQSDNPDEDIDLYINSPGGSVYDGLAIKDVIDNMSCKINTIGVGICMSMGAYLLSCGTGIRKATKNCRIMLHSVSGGFEGTFHDMKISFDETKFLQDRMMEDIAAFTNGVSSVQELRDKTQRDNYLSVDSAIELGLIDQKI